MGKPLPASVRVRRTGGSRRRGSAGAVALLGAWLALCAGTALASVEGGIYLDVSFTGNCAVADGSWHIGRAYREDRPFTDTELTAWHGGDHIYEAGPGGPSDPNAEVWFVLVRPDGGLLYQRQLSLANPEGGNPRFELATTLDCTSIPFTEANGVLPWIVAGAALVAVGGLAYWAYLRPRSA